MEKSYEEEDDDDDDGGGGGDVMAGFVRPLKTNPPRAAESRTESRRTHVNHY